jgi:mannose-6-phosphate isomerase-like protein (cupin superfamily)
VSEIEPNRLESLISDADRTPIEKSGAADVGLLGCKSVPESADAVAPDGSDVRVLLALARGGLAHFELAPGDTSIAVRHRTVEEIWYFIGGNGEMWRSNPTGNEVVDVGPGVCITIPVGTHFQFRSTGSDPLAAIGVTMPPWPGEGEAIRSKGPWDETVLPGPGLVDE